MKNEGGGVLNCELQVMSCELHCGHSHRSTIKSCHLKIQMSLVFLS
jgi:hypothetical protein